MPPLEHGGYLWDALMYCGPTMPTGMGGARALRMQDIAPAAASLNLDQRDMLAVCEMSSAYIGGLRDGVDHFSIPPMDRATQ